MAKQPGKLREPILDPTKQAQAAKALRESLTAQGHGDDEKLLLDAVEGETGLFEMIDALLEQIAFDTALADAAKVAEGNMEARRKRVERRIEANRTLIEQALSIAEIDGKLERPGATVSLKASPEKLIVTEEAEIPPRFWKPADPTLDKKALAAALKERAEKLAQVQARLSAGDLDNAEKLALLAQVPPDIPGALLSNAAPTLQIRTS